MYISSVLMDSIFSHISFCQIGRYRFFNPTSEVEKITVILMSCDFVVWRKEELVIQRILSDSKCKLFIKLAILPEYSHPSRNVTKVVHQEEYIHPLSLSNPLLLAPLNPGTVLQLSNILRLQCPWNPSQSRRSNRMNFGAIVEQVSLEK